MSARLPAKYHAPIGMTLIHALENLGYRVIPPDAWDADRVLQNLDPENAIDDSLLRDIHRRLQIHGEKYPDRAVSVLHRNVVLYTIAAAIRALSDKGGSGR